LVAAVLLLTLFALVTAFANYSSDVSYDNSYCTLSPRAKLMISTSLNWLVRPWKNLSNW